MFGRVIRLEARRGPTEEPFFVTDELRVQVDMKMGITQQISQASVTIYNLSLENARALCDADLEPASTGDAKEVNDQSAVYVRVFAGYKDEELSDGKPPLLLEGVVMNASSRRAVPNYITQLFIVPLAARFLRHSKIYHNTVGEETLRKVITDLSVKAGYLAEEIDICLTDDVANTKLRGRTFEFNPDFYSVMNKLAAEFQFYYALRAKGIGIFPRLKDSKKDHDEFNYLQKNGQGYRIVPEMLKGTPTVGVASISIPLVFDAAIFPGYVIDTSPVQGNKSGDVALPSEGLADYSSMGSTLFYTRDIAKYTIFSTYMVKDVLHQIDNYSNTWVTVVVGTVPAAGDQDKNTVYIRQK